MTDIKNNTKKMKKRILAIAAACTAIPVKPSTPATIATIKKSSTQPNITDSLQCHEFMANSATKNPQAHIMSLFRSLTTCPCGILSANQNKNTGNQGKNTKDDAWNGKARNYRRDTY